MSTVMITFKGEPSSGKTTLRNIICDTINELDNWKVKGSGNNAEGEYLMVEHIKAAFPTVQDLEREELVDYMSKGGPI